MAASAQTFKLNQLNRWQLSFCLAIFAFLIFAATRSANYTGDAIYYASGVEGSASPPIWPGHLLYGPISLAFYKLGAAVGLFSSALAAMQWLNILAGAVGVGLMGALASSVIASRKTAILATLGFCLSYGYWIEAVDAETYATTITFMLAAAWFLFLDSEDAGKQNSSVTYSIFAGVALGVAMLLHISAILFYPAAMVALAVNKRRSKGEKGRRIASFTGTFILVGAAPFLLFAFLVGQAESWKGALAWMLKSGHGLSGSLNFAAIAQTVFGLVNSFIYLDDLGESVRRAMAGNLLGGLRNFLNANYLPIFVFLLVSMLGALVLLATMRRRAALRKFTPGFFSFLLAWIVPFTLLGIWYFPSDTERWIMILPALWLWIGMVITTSPASLARRERAVLGITVLLLAIVNAAGSMLPGRDLRNNLTFQTAQAIHARVAEGDGVIVAGREWQCEGYLKYFFKHRNCVSLFSPTAKETRDLAALREKVSRYVAATESHGGTVWLYGDLSTPADQSRPWTDFAALGISKKEVVAALSNLEMEKVVEITPGEWLYRLSFSPAKHR